MTRCLAYPWDYGVTWFSRRIVDPTDLPVTVAYISRQVLRVANGNLEDESIEQFIYAATQAAEDDTHRALMPQTWELVLSGFPSSGVIVLPRPPLIEVTSVSYYNGDDTAELAGSPAEYSVVPSGRFTRGKVLPLDGASFPTISSRDDAVTITYRAGYTSTTDKEFSLIQTGIGVMVAELYKQRSLSVQEPNNTKAQLDLSRFWREVR
jgi:uncharacterized phiE125 gp8 family phage protein